MLSFQTTFVIAAITAFSMVSTQTIDPNSVPIATRQQWCNQQIATCPALCIQINSTSSQNTCNATTLAFDCECNNGLSPNASEFSLTIPYFECSTFDQQCVSACPQGDSTCQEACNTDHPCGAQNPTRINASTTSTTATSGSATGSSTSGSNPTVVFTGFGSSGTTSASGSKSGGRIVIDIGASYSLAVVFASLFAGFALL